MIEYNPILIYIITITYIITTFFISFDLNSKLCNYSSYFNEETWSIIQGIFIILGAFLIKMIF